MGPLYIQPMGVPPGRFLVPVPVGTWRKDVIVTTHMPSVPGLRAKFTQLHLAQGQELSIAKLFEILREEGFQGEPGDYVVRDEFNDKLVSHRHLCIAFQNLFNEEKLSTTWRVLKIVEDEALFPRYEPSNLLDADMTTNGPGPFESLLGDDSVMYSDVTIGPSYPNDVPALPDASPKEGNEIQGSVNAVEEPKLPDSVKVKQRAFLDISDSSEASPCPQE